MKATLT